MKNIPPDAVPIHLYEFSNVLRPRGHMEKESIGIYILERLISSYESWTDPKYGDNPDTTTLIKLLQDNMKEEMDGAWREFIKRINTNKMQAIPDKMHKRIKKMALRTWDVIGGDMLTLLEEQGAEPVMPKVDVVEVVCDASYMMYHGGDKEAYEFWNQLPRAKKMELVSEAFTFPSYGW